MTADTMMNLPNTITISRIIFTIIFIFFINLNGISAKITGFYFVILAIASDFLDGYIARKRNLVTDFGTFMDPLADKFLTISAFFILSFKGIVPLWISLIVFLRETIVTAIRISALRKSHTLPADVSGKQKTALQMVLIVIALAYIVIIEFKARGIVFLTPSWDFFYQQTILTLSFLVVVMTVYSGVVFLIKKGDVSCEKS